jgi:hypothetical protein
MVARVKADKPQTMGTARGHLDKSGLKRKWYVADETPATNCLIINQRSSRLISVVLSAGITRLKVKIKTVRHTRNKPKICLSDFAIRSPQKCRPY